jgi:hypothetical protein
VHVTITHIHRGDWCGDHWLRDRLSGPITSSLDDNQDRREPFQLALLPVEPSKGVNPSGEGFILTEAQANEMLSADPRNGEVIRHYLNGAELNASSSGLGPRYIIDFRDWDREKAKTYKLPWKHVEEHVGPQRAKQRMQVHEKDFWKFEDKRPELQQALRQIKRAIVFSEVSKYFSFGFVSADQLFSPSLRVVPTDDVFIFGVLQSAIHVQWAHEYQYQLKGDPRYSIGRCFRTFPFPDCSDQARVVVRRIADEFHERRSSVMLREGFGLREFYDHLHQPSDDTYTVARGIQAVMDKAVAAAYQWSDIDLCHGFHETKQGLRFTINEAARCEVLARLLKLNHERYAEEQKQAGGSGKSGKTTPKRGGRKTKAADGPTLF